MSIESTGPQEIPHAVYMLYESVFLVPFFLNTNNNNTDYPLGAHSCSRQSHSALTMHVCSCLVPFVPVLRGEHALRHRQHRGQSVAGLSEVQQSVQSQGAGCGGDGKIRS